MIAAALRAAGRAPVHNRAGSNMTWGVATALLEQRGEEGLFEVDEAWLPRVAAELDPRLIVLGNLFRDQLDRYGELEHLADEWAALVAARAGRDRVRAQRRRPADRRPGARPRARAAAPASPTSGSRTPARRCRSSSTPSTPSTAAAAARRTRTSAPSSATSATTRARTAAPTGPRPTSPRRAIELEGMRGSRVAVRAPEGEVELAPPPPRPLQRLQRARRADRRRCGSASRSSRPPARWRRCEAVFGRVETIEVAGKRGLHPADQEPGRRQRGAAHAAARGGATATATASTSGSRSTTGSPTAATSPGSGTPTSSCSPAASAASSARAPGPPRWRCA